MNLSIFLSGYLGSQLKDTPHSGSSALFRYGIVNFLPKTTDELLLTMLGLNTHNELPLAALIKQGELAVDQTSTSFCLLAQPVYLQLQRDSFGLSEVVKLSCVEYEKLSAELNEHFNEEGITFIKSQTQQYWFVSFDFPMSVSTHPLQTAIHQNINALQPYGKDAKQLLKVINQVQMLLHEHSINIVRSEQGEVTINSLWLSGEGALPLGVATTLELIGQGSLLKGMMAITDKTPYANLESLLNGTVNQAIAIYEDIHSIEWDKLYQAVKQRKIKQLEISLPIENSTLHLSMTPWDCWKFWRKSQNVDSLYHKYSMCKN
ncbi:MAG: hypothetical protein ACXW1T_09705 [Methylophilus sp.]